MACRVSKVLADQKPYLAPPFSVRLSTGRFDHIGQGQCEWHRDTAHTVSGCKVRLDGDRPAVPEGREGGSRVRHGGIQDGSGSPSTRTGRCAALVRPGAGECHVSNWSEEIRRRN